MSRETSLPKYIQLAEMLIREIAAGHLIDGARLPTERAMAEDMGVAVGTLRKTLAELESKGLLERVQGSGNYVRVRPEVDSIYAFFRLELVGGGGLPTATVISVRTLAKPKALPFIGQGEKAHRIRRIRTLGGVPAALEEIWLDGRFATTSARFPAADALPESLYLFYKETLDLVISRVEDRVGLDPVPSWVPPENTMDKDQMAGHVERIGWDQDGQPAEFSHTWFDPAHVRYFNRV